MVIVMRGKHTRKEFAVIILGALLLTCCFFSSSYALNNFTSPTSEYNYFGTSNLELSYVDRGMGNGDVLSLVSDISKSGEIDKDERGYRFSVTNISKNDYKYRLRIVEDVAMIQEDDCFSKQLYSDYIWFQFDNFLPKRLKDIEDTGYVFYDSTVEILPGNSEIHELRIWLEKDVPQNVKGHYHGKIVLEELSLEPYESYQQSQEIKIGDSSYIVLEDSDSQNAYLKLLPNFSFDFLDVRCPSEGSCFYNSSEQLVASFERYQALLQDQLQKPFDLNLLRVRLLGIEEREKYLAQIPEFQTWITDSLFVYSPTDGKIRVLGKLESLEEKVRVQPVVYLHKDLLKEEIEEQ